MFDSAKGWTQKSAEAWAKLNKNSTEGKNNQSSSKPELKPKSLDPFEVLENSRKIMNSR